MITSMQPQHSVIRSRPEVESPFEIITFIRKSIERFHERYARPSRSLRFHISADVVRLAGTDSGNVFRKGPGARSRWDVHVVYGRGGRTGGGAARTIARRTRRRICRCPRLAGDARQHHRCQSGTGDPQKIWGRMSRLRENYLRMRDRGKTMKCGGASRPQCDEMTGAACSFERLNIIGIVFTLQGMPFRFGANFR